MTEPVIQAAETALAPIAAAALADLKQFAADELAQLEAKLPGLLENAAQEAHDVAEAALTHLRNVVGRIEQHLAA